MILFFYLQILFLGCLFLFLSFYSVLSFKDAVFVNSG